MQVLRTPIARRWKQPRRSIDVSSGPSTIVPTRQFIAALTPLLKQHGDGSPIGSRPLDATWPTTPIRVDIVHDAGPPGNAYTVSMPTHITIGASDPRHQGFASLELGVSRGVASAGTYSHEGSGRGGEGSGIRAPRNLWHGLLFFNAGTITAEALTSSGVAGYRMYALDQQAVFDRAFRGWRTAIYGTLADVLAGKTSRAKRFPRFCAELP